jgi:hypothetical protein
MRILLLNVLLLSLLILTQCTKTNINPDFLEIGDISTEGLFYHKFDTNTTVAFITRYDTLRFGIDFNQNGVDDVYIETYQEWSGIHSSFRASIITDNNFFIALHDSVNSPQVFGIGDRIDNTLRWSSGRYNLLYHYGSEGGVNVNSGLWFQTDRNYAGIKYDDGEVVRYGWICLDFVYKEIRLYDYAFIEI